MRVGPHAGFIVGMTFTIFAVRPDSADPRGSGVRRAGVGDGSAILRGVQDARLGRMERSAGFRCPSARIEELSRTKLTRAQDGDVRSRSRRRTEKPA